MPIREDEAVQDSEASEGEDPFGPVTVGHAIISQPHEGTPLIPKPGNEHQKSPNCSGLWHLESLRAIARNKISLISKGSSHAFSQLMELAREGTSPKLWNRRKVWQCLILRPAGYLPAVLLGLLLNILDALSYGEAFLSTVPRYN